MICLLLCAEGSWSTSGTMGPRPDESGLWWSVHFQWPRGPFASGAAHWECPQGTLNQHGSGRSLALLLVAAAFWSTSGHHFMYCTNMHISPLTLTYCFNYTNKSVFGLNAKMLVHQGWYLIIFKTNTFLLPMLRSLIVIGRSLCLASAWGTRLRL